MSITQNAKRAMEQAGIATSKGTEWTTEDQRNFIDFLYFNHGIGRELAPYVLVHADDQKEPLRSQLLGEGFDAEAEEATPTPAAEPEAPAALTPEEIDAQLNAGTELEQFNAEQAEQPEGEQEEQGDGAGEEGQEQPQEGAEGGEQDNGAPKEFQL